MTLQNIYLNRDKIIGVALKKYSISLLDLRSILQNYSKGLNLSWVIPDNFKMEHSIENWFIFSKTLFNYLIENFFCKKFSFGREVELAGAKFLSSLGFEIVVMNYRVKGGEIDIVCKENDVFRFVEVKGNLVFRSEEIITRRKINKILKVSEDFTNEVFCQKLGYDALIFDGSDFVYYRDYLV